MPSGRRFSHSFASSGGDVKLFYRASRQRVQAKGMVFPNTLMSRLRVILCTLNFDKRLSVNYRVVALKLAFMSGLFPMLGLSNCLCSIVRRTLCDLIYSFCSSFQAILRLIQNMWGHFVTLI